MSPPAATIFCRTEDMHARSVARERTVTQNEGREDRSASLVFAVFASFAFCGDIEQSRE
jgi:hypothetical protein